MFIYWFGLLDLCKKKLLHMNFQEFEGVRSYGGKHAIAEQATK